MIGHAVADALGVPVEFRSRASLAADPVDSMREYGTYGMPRGSWSDDTSMSLCALGGLGADGIRYDVIMDNFARWYYDGEFTPTGVLFDIGSTCRYAIENYCEYGLPLPLCGAIDVRSNGNGSLMRIHPFVLYTYRQDKPLGEKLEIIETASTLTHAHPRSRLACGVYAFVLWELLSCPTPESVREGLEKAREYYKHHPEIHHLARLFDRIAGLSKYNSTLPVLISEIKSDGYVIHSLEAAIWCLLTTDSYSSCVLRAVNLGEDTDTVAAIAGGLAGALYGYAAIPQGWREALLRLDFIEELCEQTFGIL